MHLVRDGWKTPLWLFNKLDKEFNFTVDACADEYNSLCDRHYTDCLSVSWKNERVFLNPPYSHPRIFIQKAYDESLACIVVALIKCDPSTRLWGIIYNYEQQKFRPGVAIRYFPQRLKFIPPENIIPSSPNFSSCLVIMNRQACSGRSNEIAS